MLSIQARIILGIFAVVLVASGLTIWLILSLGYGPMATLLPLIVALVVILVSRNLARRGRNGPHRD